MTRGRYGAVKLSRSPAGGLAVGHIGTYWVGTPDHWLAAVNATVEDHWSGETGVNFSRAFRPARYQTREERERRERRETERRAMFNDLLLEVAEIATTAGGLTSYEVAAILRRSARTARRFIRRARACRQQVGGPCRNRRWTGRYVFGGV